MITTWTDTDLWACDCGGLHVGDGPHRRIRRWIRRRVAALRGGAR